MPVTSWGSWGPQLYVDIGVTTNTTTSVFGVWDVSAFDAPGSNWSTDVTWTDISAYVREMTISTGNQRATEYFRSPVGTLTAVLSNGDDRFSPVNLSGPYVSAGVSQIRPRVPIRVYAKFKTAASSPFYSHQVDLFYGFVESWQDGFPGQIDATTYIECSDALSVLARFNGPERASAGAGETLGARLVRIAQNAGFAGNVFATTGNIPLQASTLAGNALTEASLAADTETGALFAGPDGSLRTYGIDDLINLLGFAELLTFGNGASDLPFADPQFAFDGDRVYNRVSLARAGGTEQTVDDLNSRALYGDLAYSRSDLIAESDADVLSSASLFLARFLAPEHRVSAVTVYPMQFGSTQPADLTALVLSNWFRTLNYGLFTPVIVEATTPGGTDVSSNAYIDGVTHEIRPAEWTTTFNFASREFFAAFGTSRWDSAEWDEARFYFG